MSGRLEGKVAVITGGASGIGRAVAHRYRDEGALVVVGDLQEAEGVRSVRCDVREEAEVEALCDLAVAEHGRIDIGVNCAGLGTLAPVLDQTAEQWDLVVDVCLKGVFLSTKHEARRMASGGVVINIASINARQPGEGLSAYCSAKAGVEMFTQVAAMELGPLGIRVCGIGPGFVDTPLTKYARDLPQFRAAYVDSVPLGRAGRPDDIASAAAFLASDDASWISGTTLFVDGAELTRSYPRMLDLARQGRTER